MPSRVIIVALLLLVLLPVPWRHPAGADPPPPDRVPRLVLFITVDQLRGDRLPRYAHRFGPGGFRRLLEQGVHYRTAHFRHATTFTASGHATLFTGGNPAEHGIVANNWQDHATGGRIYCVEDERHMVLDVAPAPHQGTSPRRMSSSTIGDELVMASGGRSRVFGVSVKDRGAILPAGHLGTAYWYHGASGRFVTSSYYMDRAPAWVSAWNDVKPADAWRDDHWRLLHSPDAYECQDDDRPFETPYGSLGRTFPHPVRELPSAPYTRTLCYTPMADELTLSFVEALLDHERPGSGSATDVLAVSFSATDYIGHAFGPHSLEAEDNLLRLDRVIARLLESVDRRVGLDRTVVILSSDHGVDAAPEHRARLARRVRGAAEAPDDVAVTASTLDADCPDCVGPGGRHLPGEILARGNAAVRRHFGIDVDLVTAFWNPCLFLDLPGVQGLGLEPEDVERVLAAEMMRVPGIALALTRSDLLAGRVPDSAITRRVRRGFHPVRSGSVTLVQEPFWFLYHRSTSIAAMHGSPYPYDTHVPIVVMTPGAAAGDVYRRVGPEDIAPTLAALLQIPAPSGATGNVLTEVLAESRAFPRPPAGAGGAPEAAAPPGDMLPHTHPRSHGTADSPR